MTRPGCLPTSCEAEAKNCGEIPDGCGARLVCGSCSGAETCGGGGTANVCGQTCYKFAAISSDGGFDNIVEGGNCSNEVAPLTRLNIPRMTFSHLSISPTFSTVAFLERHLDRTPITEYMNLLSNGSLSVLDDGAADVPDFAPLFVAFNRGETLAIVTRERDGSEAIRLNANFAGRYPAADSVVIHRLGAGLIKGLAWIPTADGSHPRHLVATVALSEGGPGLLYVFNDTESRPMPLVDPSGRTIEGSRPNLSRRGQRLFFTKAVGGHDRIFACDLSVSAASAACTVPIEVTQLSDLTGDFGGHCLSYDNAWLFYAFKPANDSNWDIYRDRYVGAPQRDRLTSGAAEEKEVACYPLLLTAVSATQEATLAPLQQTEEYSVAPQQAEAATVLTTIRIRCTKATQCPKRQTCVQGVCR